VPRNLLAEQLPDSFHNTVLLGVVRVVLGGDLEQAGESLVVLVDSGSYALGDLGVASVKCIDILPASVAQHRKPCTYVLVDQHNSDILPLPSELVESLLDGRLFGFGVDDQVVLLRVRCVGHMLNMLLANVVSIRDNSIARTPTPANKMPVTESCGMLARDPSLRKTGRRKPHLRSPPGTVGPCMLIEVTPWLL
jgi:hypothetical protein